MEISAWLADKLRVLVLAIFNTKFDSRARFILCICSVFQRIFFLTTLMLISHDDV